MALTKELAAAIAQELSPEHFAHGWRPVIEAEVNAAEESRGYMGGVPVLDTVVSFPFSLDNPQNECPCGEIAVKYTDERMTHPQSAALLAKVTGISFR